MTREEKIKKAALVAVACYLEQEKNDSICNPSANNNNWVQTGKMMIMNKRMIVQRRGKLLKGA